MLHSPTARKHPIVNQYPMHTCSSSSPLAVHHVDGCTAQNNPNVNHKKHHLILNSSSPLAVHHVDALARLAPADARLLRSDSWGRDKHSRSSGQSNGCSATLGLEGLRLTHCVCPCPHSASHQQCIQRGTRLLHVGGNHFGHAHCAASGSVEHDARLRQRRLLVPV